MQVGISDCRSLTFMHLQSYPTTAAQHTAYTSNDPRTIVSRSTYGLRFICPSSFQRVRFLSEKLGILDLSPTWFEMEFLENRGPRAGRAPPLASRHLLMRTGVFAGRRSWGDASGFELTPGRSDRRIPRGWMGAPFRPAAGGCHAGAVI